MVLVVLVVLEVCRSVSVGCCASPVTGPRFGCLRRFSIFLLCGTLSLKLRGPFSSGSDVYARVVHTLSITLSTTTLQPSLSNP